MLQRDNCETVRLRERQKRESDCREDWETGEAWEPSEADLGHLKVGHNDELWGILLALAGCLDSTPYLGNRRGQRGLSERVWASLVTLGTGWRGERWERSRGNYALLTCCCLRLFTDHLRSSIVLLCQAQVWRVLHVPSLTPHLQSIWGIESGDSEGNRSWETLLNRWRQIWVFRGNVA